MSLPGANIYWRDVPHGATVEETKTAFVVHTAGRSATAFWYGQEASAAQRKLHALAKQTAPAVDALERIAATHWPKASRTGAGAGQAEGRRARRS